VFQLLGETINSMNQFAVYVEQMSSSLLCNPSIGSGVRSRRIVSANRQEKHCRSFVQNKRVGY
jgi:hypothetical protein